MEPLGVSVWDDVAKTNLVQSRLVLVSIRDRFLIHVVVNLHKYAQF